MSSLVEYVDEMGMFDRISSPFTVLQCDRADAIVYEVADV